MIISKIIYKVLFFGTWRGGEGGDVSLTVMRKFTNMPLGPGNFPLDILSIGSLD